MKFKVLFMITAYFSTMLPYIIEASNKFHLDENINLSLSYVPSDIRLNIYHYADVTKSLKIKINVEILS